MALSEKLPLGVTAVMLAELDLPEQIELLRGEGVTHYVYRPRYIPDDRRQEPYDPHGNHRFDLTPERLIEQGPEFRRQLEAAALTPLSSVPRAHAASPEDELQKHLEGAAAGGCSSLRLLPPPLPAEAGLFDYQAYLNDAVEHFRRAVQLAEPFDLKITIEMHAGTAAPSPGLAYNIARHFQPEELGLIPDMPNFAREGEVKPALAISAVAPWIDHAHVGGARRIDAGYDQHGYRKRAEEFCPLTESDLYFPAWAELLGQLPQRVPLVIEDYTRPLSGALRLRENARALRRLLGADS